MIVGVEIVQLKQFPDERGRVMHMLRRTDPHFVNFGEIYFSTCNPGYVKAWMHHKKNTSNYAVVSGMAKIVLHDLRDDSKTKGETQEIYAGEHNHVLVKIPPGVAHGFKAVGVKEAIIANCTTEPYDANDNFKISTTDNTISYAW
jgi:dTDP-4-dehydrorhamnose 3,5-epimerase